MHFFKLNLNWQLNITLESQYVKHKQFTNIVVLYVKFVKKSVFLQQNVIFIITTFLFLIS